MSTDYIQWFDQRAENQNGGRQTYMHQTRINALNHFNELGFPSRKSEWYKYADLQSFKELKPAISKRERGDVPDFFTHHYLDANVFVFVDGTFRKDLSDFEIEDGLTVLPLDEAYQTHNDFFQRHYNTLAQNEQDSFSALNTAFVNSGLFVHAKKNMVDTRPIVILHVGNEHDDQHIYHYRHLVVVEEGAEVQIVEDTLNLNETQALYLNVLGEYIVRANASLNVTLYQEDPNNLYYIGNREVLQEKDSRYHAVNATFDGAFIRNNVHVRLNGKNAEADISGLFTTYNNDFTDNRLFIEHNVPQCTSHQLFNGIINNTGKGVFNGKILVREDAQQTNAFQQNKNVLLSDKAEIYTKPELEIYADEVKCSHGATSGALDENAIFYAISRGIPKEKAKALVVLAFAEKVIQKITNEALRNFIERRLVNKLQLSEYSTSEKVHLSQKT